MDTDALIRQVSDLRQRGISIRGIASQLGVHPSRVQRAVAKLSSPGKNMASHDALNGNQKNLFVGREKEMSLLREALDEAVAGHGNLVLLSGEPGIGKTRLLQELCSYASTSKVASYWGRCHEELQTPPFWPWRQIFRQYIDQNRVSRLRSEMGLMAADIAVIVPKLLKKLPEIKQAPHLNDPYEDRFRLFDSVSAFFNRSSKKQPLLLIIDNLQWCDEPSLLLLRFISQELVDSRIFVVGSYRNMGLQCNHHLSAALGELLCQPILRQIELQGLNQNETGQIVCAEGSMDSTQELIEILYRRTEGNPLFIIHIIKSLVKGGGFPGQESDSDTSRINSVPDSLNMAISRNLEFLSPQCLEILAVASAIGMHFNFSILKQIHKDIMPHELQDIVDEAVTGGIIGRSNPGPGWYQFSHALVRDTLLTRMKAKQRVNLHARIGTAMEEIYENHLTPVASQLAYHFAISADLTGKDKAIHYFMMAADNALAVFAYEEAALQFQRALEIKRKNAPVTVDVIPDDETAEILLGLAKTGAVIPERRTSESFGTMTHLLDYYLDKKDVARIIEIASVPMVLWDIARLPEPKRRFKQIFALVPPDSGDAGWLLCIYGHYIGTYLGEYDAAQDALNRAIDIARQQRDEKLELRALINSVQVKAAYWKSDWDKVQRAIDMAQRLEDLQVEVTGRFFSSFFATTTRPRKEAQAIWEHAVTAATNLRHHSLLTVTTIAGQVLAQYYGDFQLSRLRSEHCISGSGRKLLGPMTRAITEYELGELAEGDKFIRQAFEGLGHAPASVFVEYGWASVQLPFVNYLTAREEWPDIEDRVINFVLSTAPPETFFAIMVQVGLGLRAVNHGDSTTAQNSYYFLKGTLKSDPIRSMVTPIAMSSDRLLGLLCLTFQDYDRAIEHFRDAIKLCQKCAFLPQLAWSCYECSQSLLRRNKPGDKSEANALAAQALSIADDLGMKLLAGRINSMQGIAVFKQIPLPDSNNFTSREIEVLKLLARGKTNREIAKELVVSIHTAATHVRNILNKGNMANRVEAAAFAERYYCSTK